MKVGLSLGSNLGDRLQHLRQARGFLVNLSESVWHLASPVYETVPVDCPPNSPTFYNTVLEIEYAGTPRTLLKEIQTHENAQGRDRNLPKNAARPIDIDILYFGDLKLQEQDLIVPHPRMQERRFMLLPLATIRPDLVSPRELPGDEGEVRFVQQDW